MCFADVYRKTKSMGQAISYSIILLALSTFTDRALAQINPDTTLGAENSQVTTSVTDEENSAIQIDGGAKRGTNLFHSFQEFNVRNGQSVNFANPEGIENILSRVTGNTRSEILGTLGVLGSADLFIINPNGIIFGSNAALNVNGSFLASTADSLVFNNGFQFSATNPVTPPLLTINVPIGLQFEESAKSIVNRSNLLDNIGFARGLQVQPGNTLALVGGDVTLEGGFITAPNGRIEIGSVAGSSFVEILPTEIGWTLGYQQVKKYSDIELIKNPVNDSSSLINAFDNFNDFDGQNGEINLQGRNITLADMANIFVDGVITVNASEAFTLGEFSGIFSNSVSAQNAGDVIINVDNLSLQEGAFISTSVTGIENEDGTRITASGDGGNISVNAESVEIIDGSSLSSNTFGFGNAGNIRIDTENLTIQNAASISARSEGINSMRQPIETGRGGNIEIVDAESIELVNNSSISSRGLGGEAGNSNIETDNLIVRDDSRIAVNAIDSGAAGNLSIEAQNIELDNGSLTAETQTGNEGNISLDNADTLLLRNNSEITTNATGLATGGNIAISSDGIALLDNSDITANAERGQGGNIQITTQGILREPNTNISVDSELGIDGTVTFNTPDVDPVSGIEELPDVPVDTEAILAQDFCMLENEQIASGSSFIITGRGGLIPTSKGSLDSRDRLVDWASRDDIEVSQSGAVGIRQREDSAAYSYPKIQQSQGLLVAADGSTWLTANAPNTNFQNYNIIHPDCNTSK